MVEEKEGLDVFGIAQYALIETAIRGEQKAHLSQESVSAFGLDRSYRLNTPTREFSVGRVGMMSPQQSRAVVPRAKQAGVLVGFRWLENSDGNNGRP